MIAYRITEFSNAAGALGLTGALLYVLARVGNKLYPFKPAAPRELFPRYHPVETSRMGYGVERLCKSTSLAYRGQIHTTDTFWVGIAFRSGHHD